MKEKILIVEDNKAVRGMLYDIVSEKGYSVTAVESIQDGLLLANKKDFALILSDLQLRDGDGLDFYRKIKNRHIPFILLTAFGSIEKAVEAMKEGVDDFITKPADPDYLLLVIEKILANVRVREENIVLKEMLAENSTNPVIIGCDHNLIAEAEKAKKVALSDTPVLILGESGTGKELFARAIHNLSPRRNGPFIAVNAASIPEQLLENELFGHEKGAYTGAYLRQSGKLELARGGTFFFDEIGEMPSGVQAKLLRMLEEKTITRIGSGHEIELDVRFVFATNKDLEQAVREKKFRSDLYFRICVFALKLSPLRERKADIELLAEYFLQKYCRNIKHNRPALTAGALKKLTDYSWPGNIRELQNAIERAVILSTSAEISAAEIVLPEEILQLDENIKLQGSLKEVSSQAQKYAESAMIKKILAECNGNKTKAATMLDVSYKSLLDKIKEYGLNEKN